MALEPRPARRWLEVARFERCRRQPVCGRGALRIRFASGGRAFRRAVENPGILGPPHNAYRQPPAGMAGSWLRVNPLSFALPSFLTLNGSRIRVFRLFGNPNGHYWRTDEAVFAGIIG